MLTNFQERLQAYTLWNVLSFLLSSISLFYVSFKYNSHLTYVKSRYSENIRHKVIPRTRIYFIRNPLHNFLKTCLIRITQLDTDRFLTLPTCLTHHLLIKSPNSLNYETPKPFVFLSENYDVKSLTLILGKTTIYIK